MAERSEQSEQSERSEPPKFGNWEGGENVEYTDYFEKAGKGRSGAKRKPNDPKEKYSNSTESEEPSGQKLPEVVSSEHESHIDNFHHRHGGVRPRSSKFESDTPKGPVDTLKSSQEEGDMKRANDSPLRHDTVSRKATNVNSPHHRQGGGSTADGSKRTARQSTGFDRSIEHSPLHPNHQARVVNKGSGVSSPSWERKGSAEGSSHGVPPTTPGRSRLRSGTRGDETTDEGPTVPKFGDWDENDPKSAEGFTQVFDLVRDEKNCAGKAPVTSNASSYPNGQNRRGNESSKGCLCFPWGRK